MKFKRRGVTEAWGDVLQRIREHLDRNKKENNPPKNILAAGITFTDSPRKRSTVLAYKAKLFAPNGRVIARYFSRGIEKDSAENDPDEHFIKTGKLVPS